MPHPVRRREPDLEPGLTEAELADARRAADRVLADAEVQAAIARIRADPALSAATESLGALAGSIASAVGAFTTVGLPLDALVALVTRVVPPMIGAVADVRAQLPPAEASLWRSVGASFADGDAPARARARTASAFGRLVEGSVRGDAEMARMLGVDRTRVSQRVSERSLYTIDGPDGRCFPRWQVHEGKPIRGLKAVLGAFDPGLHPLTVDRWMTAPNEDLRIDGEPASPVEWLTTGGAVEALVDLASEL